MIKKFTYMYKNYKVYNFKLYIIISIIIIIIETFTPSKNAQAYVWMLYSSRRCHMWCLELR